MKNIEFLKATESVSRKIRQVLYSLGDEDMARICEVRLRTDRPLTVTLGSKCLFVSYAGRLCESVDERTVYCTRADVNDTFSRLCGYSVHTYQSCINSGFVPIEGGHRAAVVGTAVVGSNGCVTSVTDITSINIRIARQIIGCGEEIVKRFLSGENKSLIIAGAPSSGKTTVLRDIIRILASPERKIRVSAIDERDEIACSYAGRLQTDVGVCCDVLSRYPKSQAVTLAVRTLSPQYIACDEICTEEEVGAIVRAVNCGVKFIVTVHASSYEELLNRPIVSALCETGCFDSLVLLDGEAPCKIKQCYEPSEVLNEIYRRRSGFYSDVGSGSGGIF